MYLFVKQMDKVNANYRISGIKDMDVNQDYREGQIMSLKRVGI